MTSQSTPGFTWARKRVWSVMAKPVGRRSGGKLCSSLFSASETAEQALDKVAIMASSNAEFRRVWGGWQFFPVDLSELIEVTPGGVVLRHINERVEKGVRG